MSHVIKVVYKCEYYFNNCKFFQINNRIFNLRSKWYKNIDLKFNYYNTTTRYDNNWKIKREKDGYISNNF